jgi:hypothetical protein
MALALRAGFAVRFGILPSQSYPLRGFDPAQIHGVKQNRPHKAACFV